MKCISFLYCNHVFVDLLGRPRGTPVHSSLPNLRTRPKTVASNLGIQKQGGLSQNRYGGQIIPRPKNDGLSPSKPRSGENYRKDITDSNLSNNNVLNKRGRGSSTLSTPQKAKQSHGTKKSNQNSGFLSR